jgi:spermidine synthase
LRFLQAGMLLLAFGVARASVVFETTSPYHHIQVVDDGDVRFLCFDRTTESRMSLSNPLTGHFEYTEMFHLVWLWNARITNILMIGLGGGSTQRAFEHDYPGVQIDTAEIDPAVMRVATNYFHFQESPRQHVFLEDGRVHLRRTTKQFDAIFVDAYAENRYGAFIPQHLLTQEFFALAASRLSTNGVLAYNVMGQLNGWQAGLLGATYKTLKSVFPQVYIFPCRTSQNVVLIATKAREPTDLPLLWTRADFLRREGRLPLPTSFARLNSIYLGAPLATGRTPLLTDDFAPVEGLLQGLGRQD